MTTLNYYSQWKQDKFLFENFFQNLKNGVFVDIGAHNGVTFSNSLFFNNLGWKGICVEPVPRIFKELEKNRPNSININCAICETEGEMDFISLEGYTEMLSGIMKFTDPRHFKRIQGELYTCGGSYEIIKVKTRRLESLLEENNITYINYLSIDVEGAEESVIKSINFNKVFIDIIEFEDNYSDNSDFIKKYLDEKGFIFLRNDDHNIFMINEKSKFID